jgi:hypothetical protein
MKVEGGREGRKEDGARMVPRITEMGKRWRSQIGLSNKGNTVDRNNFYL